MAHPEDQALDARVAARLRSNAPMPDEQFTAALERRLLPPDASPATRRGRRPALTAGAFGAAVAVAALVLAMIGQSPAPHDDEPAEADSGCRLVPVTRSERVPSVVEADDGRTELRYRKRRVEGWAERCGR